LWVIFALLDPDWPDWIRIQSGSATLPLC
jgi:hypothetical protein